jgi:hypothetical protein
VEATGLLNWGGASAVAAVAVVRFRPTRIRGRSRVKREAIALDDIDLDLVKESSLREEAAVDRGMRRDQPMAMTTQLPRGTANEPAATAAPPTGLPSEQLYTWLEWVQDDLRRLEARLDYLESARSQLREQERLLTELLHASGSLTRS